MGWASRPSKKDGRPAHPNFKSGSYLILIPYSGQTIAIFDRQLPPRSYLLAAFLEEARSTKGQIYLEIIDKIECSKI